MKTDTLKDSFKRQLLNLSPPIAAREETTKRDVRTDWIPFFKGESKNLYPNDLALRFRRSPTHAAIINSKHTYSVGEGLIANDQPADEVIKNQPEKQNTIGDVYSGIMLDWILTGNVWIEVDPEAKVLFHRDATQWRESLDRKEALGSKFWPKIEDGPSRVTEDYPVTRVPLKPKGKKNYMLHFIRKEPEYEVYGMPDYKAALTWCDVEYHIANYNRELFERGFLPSAYIGFIGEPPDGETRDSYSAAFRDAFTGEGGYQKLIGEWLEDKDHRTIIELFKPDVGQFSELQKLAVTNIISAHSWFASLSGIVVPGSLGDYKSLTVEYEAAINGVIVPRYQKPVLRFLETALSQIGITVKLDVEQVSPLTLGERVDPMRVLTKDELRAEINYDEIEGGKEMLPEKNADNQRGSTRDSDT